MIKDLYYFFQFILFVIFEEIKKNFYELIFINFVVLNMQRIGGKKKINDSQVFDIDFFKRLSMVFYQNGMNWNKF